MYTMKDPANQIKVKLICYRIGSDNADVYAEQFKDLDAAIDALGDLYCEICPDYNIISDQRRGPALTLFGTTTIMDLNYRAIKVEIFETNTNGCDLYALSDLEVNEACRAGYNLRVDDDEDEDEEDI